MNNLIYQSIAREESRALKYFLKYVFLHKTGNWSMIINIYIDTPNAFISDKHIVCIVKKKKPVLEQPSLLFQLILYWEMKEFFTDFLWRSFQATEVVARFYL